MMTRIFSIGALFLAGSLAFGAQPAVPRNHPTLVLLRMINTAQAEASRRGTFVALPELIAQEMFTSVRPDIKISGDAASYHDQQITLVRSADGKQYQVSVAPASDCGTAWFTSDGGVIYTGQAFGCGPK